MKHYWLKMEAIFLALVLIMPGNTLARVYEYELDNGLKLLVKEDLLLLHRCGTRLVVAMSMMV